MGETEAAQSERDPHTGEPWVICADCKHPTHDCICEYLAEIESGERDDPEHDHACCPPDDCCGGPCAAHPCWDLTT